MKYELTSETRTTYNGVKLHRIRAIKAFRDVKPGDLGGWIENEDNLSHEGDAWVFGAAMVCNNARVYGNAEVYGNAKVYGNAEVYGNARVYGNAEVHGNAEVFGNARVYGNAEVFGDAKVFGNARVYGNAEVHGNAEVFGNAWVYGNAKVCGDAKVYGDAKVLGDTLLTRFLSANRSDGFTFALLPMADGAMRISAGCRFFSFGEARDHWTRTRGGTPLGDETMMILDYLERAASAFK